MRYTFINENTGKEQTITVPDDYIARNKKALGITNREAILMYLSDEGYITDDVVRELTEKAQGAKTGATVDRKPRKAPKRREDPTKRAVINGLYDFLMKGGIDDSLMFNWTVAPIKITNPERVISFSIGNDNYELTLSKKRAPK